MHCSVLFQTVNLPTIGLCCSRTANLGQPASEKKDNAIKLMKMHSKNMQYIISPFISGTILNLASPSKVQCLHKSKQIEPLCLGGFFTPWPTPKKPLAQPQQSWCRFLIVNDLYNWLLDICQTNDFGQAGGQNHSIKETEKLFCTLFKLSQGRGKF